MQVKFCWLQLNGSTSDSHRQNIVGNFLSGKTSYWQWLSKCVEYIFNFLKMTLFWINHKASVLNYLLMQVKFCWPLLKGILSDSCQQNIAGNVLFGKPSYWQWPSKCAECLFQLFWYDLSQLKCTVEYPDYLSKMLLPIIKWQLVLLLA